MPERTPVDLLRGLGVLAEPPGAEHGPLAGALGLEGIPFASDYSDVFLFQLYPYASVHLGPEGMLGGDARDRIAGFWRAVGLTPPAEPDHLATLLGLYASLAEREDEVDDAAERVLLRESRAALLSEHLTPWVFAFLARVGELAGGFYAAWSTLLVEALTAELPPSGPGAETLPLSAHLRDAPALPDPRVEGGAPFLSGLFAPVRTGAILTRADLAAVAGGLGLGLRAGERRYALESLLAQDAERVLRALAGEVARQADGHRERIPLLGPAAEFFATRADGTAGLLSSLADEVPEDIGGATEGGVPEEVGSRP